MELKNFYICVNESREATVRVEAHYLDEAYDRLNSAYQKGIVELDGTMMIGVDMEDVTESIAHNGWYHGRTVDLELPYGQVFSESIETTASAETVENEHDVLVGQIVQLLVDYERSYAGWEYVKRDVDSALKHRTIR